MGWSVLHQAFYVPPKEGIVALIKRLPLEDCEEEYWVRSFIISFTETELLSFLFCRH